MTAHLEPGFGPLELDVLDAPARQQACAHLDSCPECAAAHASSARALSAFALALAPVIPPPALEDRVLRAVAQTNRFDAFAERAARILDLGVERARALLAAIDDAASWVVSPLPGVSLYHLEGGPAVANAIVGFVRIAPGGAFPDHTHQGEEVALVLQGSCVEGDGRVARRGDELHRETGSTHMLTARPGPDLIYLAASQNGFLIFGEHLKPGDPRA